MNVLVQTSVSKHNRQRRLSGMNVLADLLVPQQAAQHYACYGHNGSLYVVYKPTGVQIRTTPDPHSEHRFPTPTFLQTLPEGALFISALLAVHTDILSGLQQRRKIRRPFRTYETVIMGVLCVCRGY